MATTKKRYHFMGEYRNASEWNGTTRKMPCGAVPWMRRRFLE